MTDQSVGRGMGLVKVKPPLLRSDNYQGLFQLRTGLAEVFTEVTLLFSNSTWQHRQQTPCAHLHLCVCFPGICPETMGSSLPTRQWPFDSRLLAFEDSTYGLDPIFFCQVLTKVYLSGSLTCSHSSEVPVVIMFPSCWLESPMSLVSTVSSPTDL